MTNKIVLCSIVRDEEDNIQKMLNSVKREIDAVVITDTGSEDRTIELIEQWGIDNCIPIVVYRDTWSGDFSINRSISFNNAIEYAHGTGEEDWYILNMDADDIFVGSLKKKVFTADVYFMNKRRGDVIYSFWQLFKVYPTGGIQWQWKLPIHEYPTIDRENTESRKICGPLIESGSSGLRSRDPNTYLSDAFSCMKWLRSHTPDDDDYKRMLFYCGQSWGCADDKDGEFKYYSERWKQGDNHPESYISLVYTSIILKNNKEIPGAIENLSKAMTMIPIRLEAPYQLIKLCREEGLYGLGYSVGKGSRFPLTIEGLSQYMKKVSIEDDLLMQTEAYSWRYLDEIAVCSHYVNDKDLTIDLCTMLLAVDIIDEGNIDRIKENLSLSIY